MIGLFVRHELFQMLNDGSGCAAINVMTPDFHLRSRIVIMMVFSKAPSRLKLGNLSLRTDIRPDFLVPWNKHSPVQNAANGIIENIANLSRDSCLKFISTKSAGSQLDCSDEENDVD
jgi:hypothetical protein